MAISRFIPQLLLACTGAFPIVCTTPTLASDAKALAHEPKPHIVIPRVSRPPELDEFLAMRPPDDLADQLVRVEGLIQQDPADGEPASQKTQIYLGYDATNLYVVFVAFDDEPALVRANVSRRERPFPDDTVEIMLDTFHDERRAFAFLCNPYGVQWDALWTEGQAFDSAWDTVWQSRGKLTDRGYVVWMAIPFKSLRFPPREDQTWGLIFVRDIPRNNETSFWPRVTNRIEGRLNQAATLGGLEGIAPGRNIQLIPQGTARSTRVLDADTGEFEADNLDLDAGLNAKLVFKDRMTLDLTANPDYSQVELDLPQVTVNQRFEIFFPEQRPFFLDNADYFRTPYNLLFTRRIDQPRLGARLTGKVGRYAVGALLIDDETPGVEADPASPDAGEVAVNGVVRANRDVGSRSTIGVMFTSRSFGERTNRVGAVDGRIVLGANWNTEFQAVYSSTEDPVAFAGDASIARSDPAWQMFVNRRGRKINWHGHVLSIGREFNTDLGFVPRRDIREAHQAFTYNFRPEGPKLVRYGPSLTTAYITDQDGTRLDESVRLQFEWALRRQTSFSVFLTEARERLRREDLADPSLASPEGLDFPRSRVGVSLNTRFIEFAQGSLLVYRGDGINFSPLAGELPGSGEETGVTMDLTLRPTRRLRMENRYLLSRLDDEATGSRVFVNQILRTNWSYQFTIRWSLRLIFEYDSTRPDSTLTTLEGSRNLNGDVLLTYLVNPWTAVFVGYNTNHRSDESLRGTPQGADGGMVNDSQELFMKVSYLFRF